MKKHMIQGFAPLQGCLDENPQALLHLLLADILIQPARPDLTSHLEILLLRPSGDQPFPG
jgi:hypothetical protein